VNRVTTVTVVLPAYNEGLEMAHSLTVLAEYLALHRGGYEFRYLIVDDGSTDETFEVATRFARWRPNVRVLRHDRNRGVGAALRTAFADLRTDFALVLDVDLSYTPALGMQLIEVLDREGADIALASPYLRGGSVVNVPFVRRLLSREANRILSLATGGRCVTLTCMVRAYRVDALRQIEFSDDGKAAIAEIALTAIRKQMRLIEVPATLQWSPARRRDCRRIDVAGVLAQIWGTLRLAFRHRPSLWLAVPGLFPGLLPIVVGALLIAHVGATAIEAGTIATLVIQYASLALFTSQVTTFFARASRRKRDLLTEGVSDNGYSLPPRVV
jgi:dolichol-phosphate mannosyltransferase